jgi:hypothetical protein
MNIFVVLVALLTLCNLATFLLSLPSNLMAEKRDARRESSATNKTILLTVGDSSVEQKNAPLDLISQFKVTNHKHSKLLLKTLVTHNMKNDISLKVRFLVSNLFLTREYINSLCVKYCNFVFSGLYLTVRYINQDLSVS